MNKETLQKRLIQLALFIQDYETEHNSDLYNYINTEKLKLTKDYLKYKNDTTLLDHLSKTKGLYQNEVNIIVSCNLIELNLFLETNINNNLFTKDLAELHTTKHVKKRGKM